MAKTNKYSSINFNHIYEKSLSTNLNPSSNHTKPTKNPSTSSSPSYSAISSPKIHGRMLVLTRPTPKPITTPPPQLPCPQPQRSPPVPQQTQSEFCSDHISPRPLGLTGTVSPVLSPVPSLEREKEVVMPVISPKPDKFVPPHLRPGFLGREERTGPEFGRRRESSRNNFRSPVQYGEDGRPKSGTGYERMTRGGELDLGMVSRPRSSGNRPSSSGWLEVDEVKGLGVGMNEDRFADFSWKVENNDFLMNYFFPGDKDGIHLIPRMDALW